MDVSGRGERSLHLVVWAVLAAHEEGVQELIFRL